jgi:PD-(D/E)XK nuclease superfamily protein
LYVAGSLVVGEVLVISEPLCSFFDGLHQQNQFARELNQRTNRFLAEKFSPLSYIDVAEPKLSWITADLLQPDGSHGQGEVFLRAFLRALGIANRRAPAQIRVEQPTRFIESIQRRVDIKLCWSDFIVGIENKPWALDQLNQLEDYVNDLDRESKGRFLCVYLSGDGLPPDKSSISPSSSS